MHSLHAFFLQFFVFHDISKLAYLPKSWISPKITNTVLDEIFLDIQALFDGLEVEGLVPLDQVPNIYQHRRTSHSIGIGTRDNGANTNPY